jgi:hypothetical protein
MLGWFVNRGVALYIQFIDKAKCIDGPLSMQYIEWDPKDDHYICLEGQPL